MKPSKFQISGPYGIGTLPLNADIPPKPENSLRFVCVSDTHDRQGTTLFPPLPEGDFLIHCGDFTLNSKPAEFDRFINWLNSQPHTLKFVISGNHDSYLNTEYCKTKPDFTEATSKEILEKLKSSCVYICDETFEVDGLKIYGSPWVPGKWSYGYNSIKEATNIWKKVPDDVDILITHTPPHGILDQNFGSPLGCEVLKSRVCEVKPLVHVFGHVHNGYGAEKIDGTLFINAATVNLFRKPSHHPIVFDVISQ